MTDPESRLARLEEQVKSHHDRIGGIERRLNEFAPMFERIAILSEKVASDIADLQSMRTEFSLFRSKIEERDEAAREDRRQFNRWLVGLAVLILCALIGVTATVLTMGGHP